MWGWSPCDSMLSSSHVLNFSVQPSAIRAAQVSYRNSAQELTSTPVLVTVSEQSEQAPLLRGASVVDRNNEIISKLENVVRAELFIRSSLALTKSDWYDDMWFLRKLRIVSNFQHLQFAWPGSHLINPTPERIAAFQLYGYKRLPVKWFTMPFLSQLMCTLCCPLARCIREKRDNLPDWYDVMSRQLHIMPSEYQYYSYKHLMSLNARDSYDIGMEMLDILMFSAKVAEFQELVHDPHVLIYEILPFAVDLTRYGIEPNPGPEIQHSEAFWAFIKDYPWYIKEIAYFDNWFVKYERVMHQFMSLNCRTEMIISVQLDEICHDLIPNSYHNTPAHYPSWPARRSAYRLRHRQFRHFKRDVVSQIMSDIRSKRKFPTGWELDWSGFDKKLQPNTFGRVRSKRYGCCEYVSRYDGSNSVVTKDSAWFSYLDDVSTMSRSNINPQSAEVPGGDPLEYCDCEVCVGHNDVDLRNMQLVLRVIEGHHDYGPELLSLLNDYKNNSHKYRRKYYDMLIDLLSNHAQAGDGWASMIPSLLGGALNHTVNVSEKSFDRIDKCLDKLESSVEKLPKEINAKLDFGLSDWFNQFIGPNANTFLCLAFALIVMLQFQFPHHRGIKFLAYMFAMFALGRCLNACIRNVVAEWLFTNTAQGDDGPPAQAWGLRSGIDTYLNLAITGISVGVFGSNLKFTTGFDGFKNSFLNGTKHQRSVEEFGVTIKDWVSGVVTTIAKDLGYEINEAVGKYAVEIGRIQHLMTDLLRSAENRKSNAVDQEMARKLREFDVEMMSLEERLTSDKESAHVRSILKYNADRLREVRLLVKEAGFTKEANAEPFSIFLCGYPGVGKTDCSDFAMRAILPQVMTADALLDFKENPQRCIFSPAVGSQYYETYKAQMCIYWPDIFSAKEVPGKESESTFWINAYGSNVFNLNMANLAEKGKIHLVASLLFACSNQMNYHQDLFKGLNNGDAMIRRINENAWALRVKQKYQGTSDMPIPAVGDATAEQLIRRSFSYKLDRAKATEGLGPGEHNLDVWEFVQWDWKNGVPLDGGAIFSFDQWCEYNVKRYTEHMGKTKDRSSALKSFGDKIIAERLAALSKIPQVDDDEAFLSESSSDSEDYTSVMVDSEAPLDYTDIAPAHVPAFKYDKLKNEFIPVSLASRYKTLEHKVDALYENGKDVVPYLTSTDRHATGLKDFVKQYLLDCYRAGERVDFSVYDKSFQGDPESPIHVLIARCNMQDLEKFVKWNMSDEMWLLCLKARDSCTSLYDTIRTSALIVMRRVKDGINTGLANSLLWFMQNPVVAGLALGAITLASFWTSYTIVTKAIDWFTGTETVSARVEPCTHQQGHIYKCFNCTGGIIQNLNHETAAVYDSHSEWFHERIFGTDQYKTQIDESPNDAYIRKWMRNMYKIRINYTKNGVKQEALAPGTLTFLGRHTAFTNYHVWIACKRRFDNPGFKDVTFELVSYCNGTVVPDNVYLMSDLQIDDTAREKDLVIITFPSSTRGMAACFYNELPSRADKKYVDYIKNVKRLDLLLVSKKKFGPVEWQQSHMSYYGCVAYDYKKADEYVDGVLYSYPPVKFDFEEFARLDIKTYVGQCGEIGWCTDSTLGTPNPVPCYMHAMEWSVGVGGGRYLYKEDFDFVKDLILKNNVAISPHEDRLKVDDSAFGEAKVAQVADVSDHFESWHHVVATAPKINMNMSTAIARSKLYKPVKAKYGITRTPAWLFPRLEEGKWTNPTRTARQDYGSNTEVLINYTNVDCVTEQVCGWLFELSSPPKDRRMLTFDEAVLGCPSIHMKQLHASTSCGYVLKCIKDKFGFHGKGKTWIFPDPEHLDLDTPQCRALRRMYDKSREQLLSGDRMLNIYLDCLKDELRAHDKASKPRHFCACDVDFLLQSRSAFGAFAGWIYENRLKTPFMIGINPTSKEWDFLYRSLISISNNGIFGDFSKYDKKLVQALIYATRRLCERYYGDYDLEGNRVRELLFEEMVNSLHAVNDGDHAAIYEWLHGNTSGNFLTAIINSMGNVVAIVCCACDILMLEDGGFNKCAPSKLPVRKVLENTCIRVYGDDNAITVGDKIKKVDFYSLQDSFLRLWRLTYTDELKGTNGEVPPFRPVHQGNLIGRGFVPKRIYNTVRIVAPLRWYSIVESLAFLKKGNPISFPEVIDNAILEVSLHGEAVFNDFIRWLIHALADVGLPEPIITSYRVALDMILNRDSPYYSPMSQQDELDFCDFGNPTEVENHCAELGRQALLSLSDDNLPTESKDDFSRLGLIIPGVPCEREANTLTVISTQADDPVINEPPMPGIICDSTKTTCFVEAESKIESTYKAVTRSSDVEVTMMSIVDFLGKPMLLSLIDFSTSSVANGNLNTSTLGSLLASNSYWANKIQGFNLVKGTFVIRLEVNAQPFQLGKLLLHWLPNVTNRTAQDPHWIGRYNPIGSVPQAALMAKYQHPHVELDIRRTNATMRVPYIAPTDFYEVASGVSPYDWGTIYLDVVQPLLIGTTSTETDVWISMFVHLEDVELAAPCVPQVDDDVPAPRLVCVETNPGPKGRRRADREDEEAARPSVSSSLQTVSKVASDLSSIPMLSAIAEPVSWAAGVASSIASVFGWAKPRINEQPNVMWRQINRYMATSDGPEVAIPTALTLDNKVCNTTDFALTDEDEMSFKYLCSVPAYMTNVQWTTSNAQGVSLYSLPISPYNWYVQDTSTYNSHTATWRVGSPSYFLSNFFTYWRGTVIMTLKFIKTQYHSGRIQVTWTPTSTYSATPNVNSALLSLRQIIDIREQEELELELPYMLPYRYCCAQNFTGQGAYPNVSGYLEILVLNELRCPETCSSTIGMQVFFRAGEDFEFQAPSNAGQVMPVVFTPQVDDGTEILKAPICETQIKPTSTRHSEQCIGEHFLSIKQMLNRYSTPFFSATPYNGANFQYFPWAVGVSTINTSTGALTTGDSWGDVFSIFAPMYAYYKGGMKVHYLCAVESTSYIATFVASLVPNWFQQYAYNATKPWTNGGSPNWTSGSIRTPSVGDVYPNATILPTEVNNQLMVQIPYQCRTPISTVWTFDGSGTTTLFTEPSVPTSGLSILSIDGNFTANSVLQRGCLDDFQFSFFLNAPPLLYSYS